MSQFFLSLSFFPIILVFILPDRGTNYFFFIHFSKTGDLNAEKVLKLEKLVQPQSQPLRDLKRYLCDPSIATTLPRKNVIKNTLWHCQSLRDRVNVKVNTWLSWFWLSSVFPLKWGQKLKIKVGNLRVLFYIFSSINRPCKSSIFKLPNLRASTTVPPTNVVSFNGQFLIHFAIKVVI